MFRDVLAQAVEQIRQSADPTLADENKSYFKSPFLFHGVSKKGINDIAKTVKRNCKIDSVDTIEQDLNDLWASDFHEEKTLAIVVTSLYHRLFIEKHVKGMFKSWLDDCRTWDHVDELCIRVIGQIVLRCPNLLFEISDWSISDLMWVRRASLLAHLPQIRSGSVNYELLENTCERLVTERDFFIGKAIGWVLRELSEKRPDDAEQVVKKIGHQASRLTLREATRKLSSEQREHIFQHLSS